MLISRWSPSFPRGNSNQRAVWCHVPRDSHQRGIWCHVPNPRVSDAMSRDSDQRDIWYHIPGGVWSKGVWCHDPGEWYKGVWCPLGILTKMSVWWHDPGAFSPKGYMMLCYWGLLIQGSLMPCSQGILTKRSIGFHASMNCDQKGVWCCPHGFLIKGLSDAMSPGNSDQRGIWYHVPWEFLSKGYLILSRCFSEATSATFLF